MLQITIQIEVDVCIKESVGDRLGVKGVETCAGVV